MEYRGGSFDFRTHTPANDNAFFVHWADNPFGNHETLALDNTVFVFKGWPISSPVFFRHSGSVLGDDLGPTIDDADDSLVWQSVRRNAALVTDADLKRNWEDPSSGLGVREFEFGAVLIGLSSLLVSSGIVSAKASGLAGSEVSPDEASGGEANHFDDAYWRVSEATEGNVHVTPGLGIDVNAMAAQPSQPSPDDSAGSADASAEPAGTASEVANSAVPAPASGGGSIGVVVLLVDDVSTPATVRAAPTEQIVRGGASADLLIGGAGDDVLIGRAGDDRLLGGDGDDVLDGGQGSDVMRGGAGDDIFVVDDPGDEVIEDEEAGTDTVLVQTKELSVFSLADRPHVENLVGMGSASFTGIGNELANIIAGGSGSDDLSGAGGEDVLIGGYGDDLLDGGHGADAMAGGSGNDTYFVDDAGDWTVEDLGSGYDTVITVLSEYQLDDAVENLTAGGAGSFTGHGNYGANIIVGGDYDDRLYGDARDSERPSTDSDGAQIAAAEALIEAVLTELHGGPIDVIVVPDDQADQSGQLGESGSAAAASDIVIEGSRKNDTIISVHDGNDSIDGGGGNDAIDGGEGDDTLTGGYGNDTFIFRPSFGNDVITDFSAEVGSSDVIYLASSSFTDYDDLDAHIEQVFGDVVITVTASDHITLQNVDKLSLSLHDHFVFI